jgi:ADP-heptose:LPS heptosyltransferase
MKILFFRRGAIGDALLTTAAVKKTRELFPDAEIHYLAGEAASQVLINNPDINTVFVLKPIKNFLPREFEILFYAPFLLKTFSKYEYDYFVDFESNYFSTYVSFFIKTKKKIGHNLTQKKRMYLNKYYTNRVNYIDGGRYSALRHLSLIKEMAEFSEAGYKPNLTLTETEKASSLKYLIDNKIDPASKIIMLCVSSMWESKRWPDKYWLEIVDMINKKYGLQIVVLTGPGDPKELLDALKNRPNVHVMEVNKNMRIMIAVLAHGRVLIASDGAVRHIANALKVKTIGMFGPTSETGWAYADENNAVLAVDMECRPCYKAKCRKNYDCLKAVKPDMVMQSLDKLLK